MTEPRKIKTLKDTNYFDNGTYKRQFVDYMTEIGLASIIARTILAPLERWRLIKQTQIAYPLRPIKFNSIVDYASRIPKQQGLTAFWRGNMAGIWLYFYQSFIQIALYDNLKDLQKELVLQQQPGSFFRLISQRMFIPIISTFFTQVITFPIDTARVRLSMNYTKQKKNFPFTGIRTCLRQLRSQQSLKGMYKGFFLSCGTSLLNFNLFLAFSSAVRSIEQQQMNSNLINIDTISSVLALGLVHPLDTLKKIVQLDNLSSPSLFKNSVGAVNYIKRQASLRALYNGLSISVIKSFMFLPIYYLAQQTIKEGKSRIQF